MSFAGMQRTGTPVTAETWENWRVWLPSGGRQHPRMRPLLPGARPRGWSTSCQTRAVVPDGEGDRGSQGQPSKESPLPHNFGRPWLNKLINTGGGNNSIRAPGMTKRHPGTGHHGVPDTARIPLPGQTSQSKRVFFGRVLPAPQQRVPIPRPPLGLQVLAPGKGLGSAQGSNALQGPGPPYGGVHQFKGSPVLSPRPPGAPHLRKNPTPTQDLQPLTGPCRSSAYQYPCEGHYLHRGMYSTLHFKEWQERLTRTATPHIQHLADQLESCTKEGPRLPIILDFETCSTQPIHATQVFVKEFHRPGALLDALVCPREVISPKAEEITGLTSLRVLREGYHDCVWISELLGRLRDVCQQQPEGRAVPLLVAHNLFSFDLNVLKHSLARYGVDLARFSNWNCLDTLPLARQVDSSLQMHKLGFLIDHYGLPRHTAHSADGDVLMLESLLAKLNELKGNNPWDLGPLIARDTTHSYCRGIPQCLLNPKQSGKKTRASSKVNTIPPSVTRMKVPPPWQVSSAPPSPNDHQDRALDKSFPQGYPFSSPFSSSGNLHQQGDSHLLGHPAAVLPEGCQLPRSEDGQAHVKFSPSRIAANGGSLQSISPVTIQSPSPPEVLCCALPAGAAPGDGPGPGPTSRARRKGIQNPPGQTTSSATNDADTLSDGVAGPGREPANAGDKVCLEDWVDPDPSSFAGMKHTRQWTLKARGEVDKSWHPVTSRLADFSQSLKWKTTSVNKLHSAGLLNVYDLLHYYPRQIVQYQPLVKDADVQYVQAKGRVVKQSLRTKQLCTLNTVVALPADPEVAGTDGTVAVQLSMTRPSNAFLVRQLRQIQQTFGYNQEVVVRAKLKKVETGGFQYESNPKVAVRFESWDPQFLAPPASLYCTLQPVYSDKKPLKGKDINTQEGKPSGMMVDVVRKLCRYCEQSGSVDPIPDALREKYSLHMTWEDALQAVHLPTDMETYKKAVYRLAFQEVLLQQLCHLLHRMAFVARHMKAVGQDVAILGDTPTAASPSTTDPIKSGEKPSLMLAAAEGVPEGGTQVQGIEADFPFTPRNAVIMKQYKVAEAMLGALPFSLTSSQKKVVGQILGDLREPFPMLRLLQGEVGSGKTVVALLAMCVASGSGYQSILLAPTELLAQQHYSTISSILEGVPLAYCPQVALVTSSTVEGHGLPSASKSPSIAKKKQAVHSRTASGIVDIVVGTHALLNMEGCWSRLGLVVIDEQHKFGVKQRETIPRLVPEGVHLLNMTATPIPRSQALIQYGNMSLSAITELPPGRKEVKTYVVLDDEEGRAQVYEYIRKEIDDGGRAFIVCPLVEDKSLKSGAESLDDFTEDEDEEIEVVETPEMSLRAVKAEYERLNVEGHFAGRVGLMHGKMKAQEKMEAMAKFKSGELPILISSTVVEVGVDVAEASIMMVERADRFGLAALHQLRGRVGRGARPSKCFLMAPGSGSKAMKRLQVMEASNNGLEIAERDLQLRGPGEILGGTKQSGQGNLSRLCMKELRRNPGIVQQAREAAEHLLATTPVLSDRLQAALYLSGYTEDRLGTLGA